MRQRSRRAWLWRMRVGGTLMVGACFAPVLIPGIFGLGWNWPLIGRVDPSKILIPLPGAALVAVLAPRVSYRRRDALTVFFVFPAGLRIAWIIGTRLAQLPHRTWPTRDEVIPVHDRHFAWIALAANRYHTRRQRRVRGPSDRAGDPLPIAKAARPVGDESLPTSPARQ